MCETIDESQAQAAAQHAMAPATGSATVQTVAGYGGGIGALGTVPDECANGSCRPFLRSSQYNFCEIDHST